MKRITFFLTIAAFVSLLIFQSCETKNKAIVIGNESWTLNRSLTYVTMAVLEEKGFKVKVKNERIEGIFKQMAEGTVDLYMDAWEDAHYVYIYEKPGLVDLGELYAGCKMGVAVPSYFDLDSVAQMKADSSIYGNVFYGVKKDAGVMISAITAFKNYGMNPEIMELEEDQLMDRVQMMVDKNENFVMSAWTPHWMMENFDLKFLADTSASFGETDEIHKYSRPNFEDENPRVAEIIKRIKFSDDQMSSLQMEMMSTKNEEEYKAAAAKWIADNRGVVNSWLGK